MDMKEKARMIRAAFSEKKEKAADLEVLMAEIMKLPYGQLKKILSEDVLAVLAKYGYGE
jgi:ribosomal 50S subunit-associated protein YjgA (DUF615 family)